MQAFLAGVTGCCFSQGGSDTGQEAAVTDRSQGQAYTWPAVDYQGGGRYEWSEDRFVAE